MPTSRSTRPSAPGEGSTASRRPIIPATYAAKPTSMSERSRKQNSCTARTDHRRDGPDTGPDKMSRAGVRRGRDGNRLRETETDYVEEQRSSQTFGPGSHHGRLLGNRAAQA